MCLHSTGCFWGDTLLPPARLLSFVWIILYLYTVTLNTLLFWRCFVHPPSPRLLSSVLLGHNFIVCFDYCTNCASWLRTALNILGSALERSTWTADFFFLVSQFGSTLQLGSTHSFFLSVLLKRNTHSWPAPRTQEFDLAGFAFTWR